MSEETAQPEAVEPEATGPKYPDIEVQLTGADGNAFNIMALVTKAMRRAGIPTEERDAYRNEAMAGDYDQLLQTTMRWVKVS